MSPEVDHIYNILLSRDYQSQLFSDLQGRRKEGREQRAICPFCSLNGFSYSTEKPLWRCWNCEKTGDWLKYLEERRGLDFQSGLQELASIAGVELSGFDKVTYRLKIRRADILETAGRLFRRDLNTKLGEPVLAYLKGRGYTDDDIQNMEELGAYVSRERLQEKLEEKGYTFQEIEEAGLLTKGFGEDYQLTLLWRDQAGRAVGLATRSILSSEELKSRSLEKYKYSIGLKKKEGLIGFTTARGKEYVVLVEGPLDALYLNSKDATKNQATVALGGKSLSLEQLRAIEAAGTRHILLALDNEEQGRAATDKIIDLLRTSAKVQSYVISLPPGYKDPDELVRAQGIHAFLEACDKAEHWTRWKPRYLLSLQNLQTDTGLDRALQQALETYAGIDDGIDSRRYMESLVEVSGFTEEQLESRARAETEQASRREQEAALKSLLNAGQQKLSERDFLGAELDIKQGLQRLQQTRGVSAPKPYLLEDVLKDLQRTPDGLLTQWPSLNTMVRIPPGALSIVAGRPGHGKTTLQLNMLIGMLERYPDRAFHFYSFEEAKSRLALKLIMLLAGQILSKEQNQEAYLNYIKFGRGSKPNKDIEQAFATYQDWTESGRLVIQDTRLTAEDLTATIGHTTRRGLLELGAVFVDYIQKIPLQRVMSMRYLEMKEVSGLLLEQAKQSDIPIILGAQLGRAGGPKDGGSRVRLDNLREAGDIEQDASLVLGLFNKTAEETEETGQPSQAQEVELEISVLKQRGGIQGRKAILTFERPSLRITDKNKLNSGLY